MASIAWKQQITPQRRPGSRGRRLMIVVTACVLLLLTRSMALGGVRWPWADYASPPGPPHPAVARIIVAEKSATSMGTGTLVAVTGKMGLVVTNWHVVRDAVGDVQVVFPDGFRSAARVLGVDRNWDLAALLIWRPAVQAIALAQQPPRPGDPLTIAGYGSGTWQAKTGRCTQYVAPSEHDPLEMVEVSVPARQGDSGGPILNPQGQLAGVLFGSGGGTTAGSHIGRVRQFLTATWPYPAALPDRPPAALSAEPDPQSLAQLPRPPASANGPSPDPPDIGRTDPSPPPAGGLATVDLPRRPTGGTDRWPPPSVQDEPSEVAHSGADVATALPGTPSWSSETSSAGSSPTAVVEWGDLVGRTPLDLGKTILAVIGALALIAQLTGRRTEPADD